MEADWFLLFTSNQSPRPMAMHHPPPFIVDSHRDPIFCVSDFLLK